MTFCRSGAGQSRRRVRGACGRLKASFLSGWLARALPFDRASKSARVRLGPLSMPLSKGGASISGRASSTRSAASRVGRREAV